MSGAEVLAIAGGVAAFTGLLKNAKDTVSWIRAGPSGEQLFVEICEVELRFELLSELLAALQKLGFKEEDIQSKVLKDVIEKISRRLRDLQDIVNFGESLKDARKRDRAKHAFKQPARTKELQQCLRSLDSDLDLVYKILHIRAFSRTLPGLDPAPMFHLAIDAQQSEQATDSSQDSKIQGSELIVSRSYPTFFQRSRCSRGTCPCSCHHTIVVGYRRHWLDSPPLASIFVRCNCSSKRFTWVFNAFQRQISLAVTLAYEQTLALVPTLRVVNSVPNTSPLFVVLCKYTYGFISLESALSNIHKIVSTGAGSLYDVNRSGNNWFEELFQWSYSDSEREAKLALISHLTSGKVSIDSEKLFLCVVPWMRRDHNTRFLETILPRNGQTPLIDPTRAHATFFHQCYDSYHTHWLFSYPEFDPCLIKGLPLFVDHCLDFGDTGPLQYQILTSSLDAIVKCLDTRSSASLIEERNFLGQSALHISIGKPRILELLLSRGFDAIVDAGDGHGATPLMYAATYGESDSAIELLRAGADPKLTDTDGNTFLYFAIGAEKFQLITDVYHSFNAAPGSSNAQWMIDESLYYYFRTGHMATDTRLAGLQTLLELGARPWGVAEKGNTLFHTAQTVEEASLLLKYYSPLRENSRNAVGYTPFMMLSRLLDVDLTRNLISSGLAVHERDYHGWSVLEHVLHANISNCEGWGFGCCARVDWIATVQIVSDLLKAGVNFGTPGTCQCPCSPRGCNALRLLLPGIHSQKSRKHNISWIPWIIELFLLLRRLQEKELQSIIRSLIRRQRFDEIGTSHTCCLNYRLGIRYVDAWDIGIMKTLQKCCPDFEELLEEQQQLIDELEQYCEKDLEDLESTFLKTLARRVVFIERGSEQFLSAIKPPLIEQERKRQSYLDSDKFEFLGADGSGEIGIDHGSDEFEFLPSFVSRLADYEAVPCIEDSMKDYLHKAKELDYGKSQTPSVQGADFLNDERQRLCELLTQEIQIVRKLSNEEADWTLDIVGGNAW